MDSTDFEEQKSVCLKIMTKRHACLPAAVSTSTSRNNRDHIQGNDRGPGDCVLSLSITAFHLQTSPPLSRGVTMTQLWGPLGPQFCHLQNGIIAAPISWADVGQVNLTHVKFLETDLGTWSTLNKCQPE